MKKLLVLAACLFTLSTVVGCTGASSATPTPAKVTPTKP